MKPSIRPLVSGLAAALAVACGGGKECTQCPQVGGNWDFIIEDFTLSQNCSWIAETGTYPGTMTQPEGGSKVQILLGQYNFSGAIYENNILSATATSRNVQGSYQETRTDSVTLNLAGDGSSFTGTWTVSIIGNDNAGPCNASVRLRGVKR